MKAATVGLTMLMLTTVTALAQNIENSVQLCYGEGEPLDRCGTIIQYDSSNNSCWIRSNTIADSDGVVYREDVLRVISMGIDYCTKMR